MFTKSRCNQNAKDNMQNTVILRPILLHGDDNSFVDNFIFLTAAKMTFMSDLMKSSLNESGFKVIETDNRFESDELVSLLYRTHQEHFSLYVIDGVFNFHRLCKLYEILEEVGCVIYFDDYDNKNKYKPKTTFDELKKCVIHATYDKVERAKERKGCNLL